MDSTFIETQACIVENAESALCAVRNSGTADSTANHNLAVITPFSWDTLVKTSLDDLQGHYRVDGLLNMCATDH